MMINVLQLTYALLGVNADRKLVKKFFDSERLKTLDCLLKVYEGKEVYQEVYILLVPVVYTHT